ncbi:tRNA1(Val) (adenine(37)-N6)-methyltransferase [Pseudothermotoga thermarum]|uniref:Methyltransferase type 11 n=1 Tax=Pseudothermotoga thermarum DSM 5069 TaxID=688269 RepID=F7YUE5_9THEM|nr:methyltransferase [Pseudothermotoga thermarum]AEH51344.1 Methyltransferase type 11 [Pseudothermotoga thermarum DSM 5069]
MKPFNENLFEGLFIADAGKSYNVTHATVVLAWSSTPNKKVGKIVELGCATGAVAAYLAKNFNVQVVGVEKEKYLAELAQETVKRNNLSDKVKIYNISCCDVKKYLPCESFDMVVANPPHNLSHVPSPDEIRRKTRTADLSTVEEFVDATFYLLRNRGYFVYVLSPNHLTFWLERFLERKLQPKTLIPVYGEKTRSAVLVVLKGVKNGGIGLKIEPPLILKKS